MPRNSSGDRFIEHALRQMHNEGFAVDVDVEFDDVDFTAVARSILLFQRRAKAGRTWPTSRPGLDVSIS